MLLSSKASEPKFRNFLIFHSGSIKRSVTMMLAVSKALAKLLSGRSGAKVPISTPKPTLQIESKDASLRILESFRLYSRNTTVLKSLRFFDANSKLAVFLCLLQWSPSTLKIPSPSRTSMYECS